MELTANGATRKVDVIPDISDLRDKQYTPSLLELKPSLFPETPITVLDQKREGACTGFALAAVINMQNQRRLVPTRAQADALKVSARMLYEMAKLHDEWPGTEYAGSSIRGAIKGFFHNGVCTEELAPYRSNQRNWNLMVEQAKNARNVGLGAYFRLAPVINDYHAALNEVGALIVSAKVHSSWQSPENGTINPSTRQEGAHAFAIVGYDETGFIIQNSWGEDWGGFGGIGGLAHWSYEDWAENIMDAWVLRLSVSSPNAFDVKYANVDNLGHNAERQELFWPRRQDIVGHFVHVDNGKLVGHGRYHTDKGTIEETADLLRADVAKTENRKYKHLLIYMHGGLNGPKQSARRIKALKKVYKRNKIYPIHFMWETGFTNELIDVLKDLLFKTQERAGSAGHDFDKTLEDLARPMGTKLWREMKLGAAEAFYGNGAGSWAMKQFFEAITVDGQQKMKVHLVGQSAGSILMGELIDRINKSFSTVSVSSCSVKGAACTIDFYQKHFHPNIGRNRRIKEFHQYNLTERRELDDTVAIYQKSLLYLISHAFEERFEMPLLGMEVGSETITPPTNHSIYYAGRDSARCNSNSHGGFDNDRATMNSILKDILGDDYQSHLAFQQSELKGY